MLFLRIILIALVVLISSTSNAQDAAARRRIADEFVGSGLRKIESTHLVLYTDLEPAPEIDELGKVFDLAVPQWCEFFEIEPNQTADWQITAYLMHNRDRFQSTQLLPRDLPPFLHGFQRGEEVWLNEQPSAYYRRHLLLHEGTHAVMNEYLGGTGPPWFMEGLAEYLGTHRWEKGKLQLASMPQHRDEVPHWGRVKIIKDAVDEGRSLSLEEVMQFGPRAHLRVEPYGWSWAAVLMLQEHPSFRDAMRDALGDVKDPPDAFELKMARRLGDKWNEAELNWQVLLEHMDYGYDVRRAAVRIADEQALQSSGTTITVSAESGWQSSGLRLEKGTQYEISASGRYIIAQRSKPWPCEAGGITIHYYRGKPLGMLLAAVVPDERPGALRDAIPVGLNSTITPTETGVLFLCVNESPSDLKDNQGELSVSVRLKND